MIVAQNARIKRLLEVCPVAIWAKVAALVEGIESSTIRLDGETLTVADVDMMVLDEEGATIFVGVAVATTTMVEGFIGTTEIRTAATMATKAAEDMVKMAGHVVALVETAEITAMLGRRVVLALIARIIGLADRTMVTLAVQMAVTTIREEMAAEMVVMARHRGI